MIKTKLLPHPPRSMLSASLHAILCLGEWSGAFIVRRLWLQSRFLELLIFTD